MTSKEMVHILFIGKTTEKARKTAVSVLRGKML